MVAGRYVKSVDTVVCTMKFCDDRQSRLLHRYFSLFALLPLLLLFLLSSHPRSCSRSRHVLLNNDQTEGNGLDTCYCAVYNDELRPSMKLYDVGTGSGSAGAAGTLGNHSLPT